jgi:hypothetical protein
MTAGLARVVHLHQDTPADQEKNGCDGNQKGPHGDLHLPQWIKDPITPYVRFRGGKLPIRSGVSKDFGTLWWARSAARRVFIEKRDVGAAHR